MSRIYSDESIPRRQKRGADRSPGAARSGRPKGTSSSWTMITEEELMGSFGRNRRTVTGPVPERIGRLLEMMTPYQVTEQGRAAAFLEQARYMEDYEDDYRMQGNSVRHIFVAYQEMSVDELRGYFSWRSKMRRGEQEEGNREFVRLYAAELISLIGTRSKEDALEQLLRIRAGRRPGGSIYADLAMQDVIRDFVIAHDMPQEYALAYCLEDPVQEAADLALACSEQADDYSLYAAVCHYAAEQIGRSRFLPTIGEDACHVIARVCRRVSASEKARGGKGLFEEILGPREETPVQMFRWLPYDCSVYEGRRYEIDEILAYECRDGQWRSAGYTHRGNEAAVARLCALVRECDRMLRKAYRYKNALPDRLKDPAVAGLIAQETEKWRQEKESRRRIEVKVDLSMLSAIRRSADITRERLLEGTDEGVEDQLLNSPFAQPGPEMRLGGTADAGAAQAVPAEEGGTADERTSGKLSAGGDAAGQDPEGMADAAGQDPGGMADAAGQDPEGAAEDAGIFSREEAAFLRMLLEGKPAADYVRSRKQLLSVFVDRINERAYDEIGDSIVELDGEEAVLVSDYEQEIRDML